jgi:multisubunit Na+/H+ antiporter MnhB subunit
MTDGPKSFWSERARFLLAIGILGFFGFLFYGLCHWLLFGEGTSLLILAFFAVLIYLVFGYLPDWLSRRRNISRRETERQISLFLLFLVGACVGSFWVPAHLNVGSAWYWRIALGIASGWFALLTRRYI